MEEKLVDRLAAAPVKKQEKVASRLVVGLSHCGTLMDEMQNWKIGKIK